MGPVTAQQRSRPWCFEGKTPRGSSVQSTLFSPATNRGQSARKRAERPLVLRTSRLIFLIWSISDEVWDLSFQESLKICSLRSASLTIYTRVPRLYTTGEEKICVTMWKDLWSTVTEIGLPLNRSMVTRGSIPSSLSLPKHNANTIRAKIRES